VALWPAEAVSLARTEPVSISTARFTRAGMVWAATVRHAPEDDPQPTRPFDKTRTPFRSGADRIRTRNLLLAKSQRVVQASVGCWFRL
jgi:hypothetical protein